MDTILSQYSNFRNMMNAAFQFIFENEIFSIFIGAGVVFIVMRFFWVVFRR